MRFETGWWVQVGSERAQVLLDHDGPSVYLRFDASRLEWIPREQITMPAWTWRWSATAVKTEVVKAKPTGDSRASPTTS